MRISDCISATPAALDRYLAALPAMSLIPLAPLRISESGGSDVSEFARGFPFRLTTA
jgi:hypothetical protein